MNPRLLRGLDSIWRSLSLWGFAGNQGGLIGRRPGKEQRTAHQARTVIALVAWMIHSGPSLLLGAAGPGWSYTLDPQAQGPNLQITEFMAANQHSLHDEDGDSPDWIEIHNAGSTVEYLDGWFLTDDLSDLTKWRFPQGIEMSVESYRVVFASGKDRTNAARPLHTNFKLASEGEYLALVDPMTNVVSAFAPAYPGQQADVSYGRDPADPALLGYYVTPTPGSRNVSGGRGFAPDVQFSRSSGTFAAGQPFSLTLSTPSSNAVIYYSLGTNVPGTNTLRYTNSIRIANTAMVRARAFEPGLLPGPVATRSYVALAADVLSFTSVLPIMILHNYGQGEVLISQDRQYVVVQTFEPTAGRSAMTNAPTIAERGSFHVRGNSSPIGSYSGKSSFFLEVQDEFGADKEVALLGLPEESDWILYGPKSSDPCLFHNALAYQLTRDMGRYAPRTRCLEVFLKDDAGTPGSITATDYFGIYVLTEKIKRDNNRVDIAKLEPEHLQEPEITGGYLFSLDAPKEGEQQLRAGGQFMNWIEPSYFQMTNVIRAPQVRYISNYFNEFQNTLNSAAWTNPVTGYAAYIEPCSWIDHHMVEVITMNADALIYSTYFHKQRGQRIEFGPVWDFDRSQGSPLTGFNPRTWFSPFFRPPWWDVLFKDPDFWQRWIDRYQELRAGPLSNPSIFARMDEFAIQLSVVQPREQARWGVLPRTGSVNYGWTVFDFGNTRSYDNEVRWETFWYANRFAFIDTNFLARPVLSDSGGLVDRGFAFPIAPATTPGTSLFYTLDGTDPRLPGGGISPVAFSNNGPITIIVSNNVRVVARSWNPEHYNLTSTYNAPLINSPWSGVVAETYYVERPPLRITEIMYHPALAPTITSNRDEDFEFIEVKNIGATPLNLNRYTIRGGIEFDFPNLLLSAGQLAVVVANTTAFQSRYGTGPLIAGVFSNHLDNAGDRVILRGAVQEPILDFEYDDAWYPVTDGFGFSLVAVDDNAAPETWATKSQWRQSASLGGSPGANDPPLPVLPRVVVNEVLSRSDAPPPEDTIELQNLGPTTADISGWFLTNDRRIPAKYRIPSNTFIAPGGFALFDDTELNLNNLAGIPFSLSSLGDAVYLFSADANGNLTGYAHGFDFGPQENGATFGRYVISTGDEQFPVQTRPTLGVVNAGPKVGPLVVSEIMYHPPDIGSGTKILDNTADEFIELRNISDSPVALFHPLFPTNTWRLSDAVEFVFPPNVTIPAHGFALVVSIDPSDSRALDAFRARYSLPHSIPVFGPFRGKLDNSGGRVELRKPDAPLPAGPPGFGFVPYLLVERIHYSQAFPWQSAADGIGPSLQRINPSAYGNDPLNWAAGRPGAGTDYMATDKPAITTQPTSQTVVEYTSPTLSVTATGPAPLSYQWQFNGRVIPGATNATLVLANLRLWQAGFYRVLAMNPGGAVFSSNAVLTVLAGAQIVRQPQSQTVNAGSNVVFSVQATSTTPIAYQWRFNGARLTGQTNPVLTLYNVTNLHEGSYDVMARDSISVALSDTALLTVLLPPQMIAPAPPLRITAVQDQPITLAAEVLGATPILYRWRRIAPSGGGIVLTNFLQNTARHFYTFVETNSAGTFTYTLIMSNSVHQFLNQAWTNAFVTILADTDHDGIPDDYESAHGLDAADPSDASKDADGDAMTNWQEYIAGTDPQDAQSYLRVESITTTGEVTIRFGAVSNRTYTLQSSDRFPDGSWQAFTDIVSQPTNHIETIVDPNPSTCRVYRVITPRLP